MLEYFKNILTNQFQAALCMLQKCIEECPAEHWEAKVGRGSFSQIVYHTLYHVDLYLSLSVEAYNQTRSIRWISGDRVGTESCIGLSKDESLEYLKYCGIKAVEILAVETTKSLQAPAGFDWLTLSRGELHLYSLRHIMHHTGQLSAYLRKVTNNDDDWWVDSGWFLWDERLSTQLP